jgi:CRP/FNR family transcriptional regulator
MTMAREYDAALLSARRLALSTSAASKLATALLDLAHMAHPPEAAPKPSTAKPIASQPLDFSLPLTHEEIGCMTGISRETVTRLLGKFRREHLLQQNGEHVTLTDPTRLDSLYCV